MKLKIFFGILFAFNVQGVFGHGGGLDSKGCHHDRKNGGYHCHRSSYTPPSSSSRTYTPNLLTPSKKKTCTVTIGNEYYEFDPDNTNDVNLQFSDKSGKVEIDCD